MDSVGRAEAATPPELLRLWDSCYDLAAPVVFFPVRHHSPACALHLGRTLEAYRPDCILIEGPADSSGLIPHLGHPDNKAPLCIYYSYTHKYKDDQGQPQEERSACYYPLLDFSPELVALRYGVGHGVETRFVDLSYAQLTVLRRARRGAAEQERGQEPGGPSPQGEEAGKDSYYDDYYLQRSAFIKKLCQKQGCRHYGELWEKLFEMEGLGMNTPTFVRSMLAVCHYARVEYPPAWLEEEGCLARERKMADEIRAAQKEYGKILVVTGGFHTAALYDLIRGEAKPEKIPAGQGESYLIPYSFAESDQLAGYQSGMPYPAFYQLVHEKLQKAQGDAYNGAVLEFLARIGGRLRKQKESTSIADEVAAVLQARGLAALREKPQAGVYDLLDGVRSAYVKGAMGASVSGVLSAAGELLRGDKMGQVNTGAELVPLLRDFRETAGRLRLKLDKTSRQEVTLEILTKPAHRAASAFFHRLQYLNVSFGELRAGPDYRNRDTSLVRERWEYAAGAKVEAQVIDASYLGGTVGEAASTALARSKAEFTACGAYSRLLIDAAVMDLTQHVGPLLGAIEESVAEDGNFASLAEAARNLLFLENAKWLLSLPELTFAGRLLEAVYLKAVAQLPTLETAEEAEDRELGKILKDLHQIARREGMDKTVFHEALEDLCNRRSPLPPPALQGAAAGLLYAEGVLDSAGVLGYATAYFFGSGEEMQKSGRFLGGLFLSAWDILFADRRFLEGLSHVLETMGQGEFLALLPDLRLAFTAFTPTQVDRLAKAVGEMLGIAQGQVLAAPVPEELLALGRELNAYAAKAMEEVGGVA